MPRRPASPAASSSTAKARRHQRVRHAFTCGDTSSTSLSRERKTASIGKRMKNVWIDGAGSISMPSPGGSSRRPSNPFMRGSIRSATVHRSHTAVPSSRTSVTKLREARGGATLDAKLARATECPEEEEEGGPEQDNEHRREDQQHEREQDLDRRLLCTLLRVLAPAPPHLVREVAHDLADRDAERLALDDRADEGAHRGRVDAREHAHQRLLDRETHPLFLQRQRELVTERTFHAPRGHLQRADETHAGLDGDDEQVDQLRQLVVDLVEPAVGLVLDELERQEPAAGDREERHDHEQHRRDVHRDAEPEPEERQPDRAEHAVAEELARGRLVDTRGNELGADAVEVRAVSAAADHGGAEPTREVVEALAHASGRVFALAGAPAEAVGADLPDCLRLLFGLRAEDVRHDPDREGDQDDSDDDENDHV